MPLTRHAQFQLLFPDEPAFRWNQIESSFFSSAKNWSEVTAIPSAMRERLSPIPWMSVELVQMQVSKNGDTHKALLEVDGGKEIETVLMKNPRGAWTICVSSQVGCAMRCGFCATGKMGLTRSLISDEIVDQYRFWGDYLLTYNLQPKTFVPLRISNIVFMGMGEPLANYEAVKESLNTLLAHTDLGKTRITVSTVGVLPRLEQILTDQDWPHVRLAVSLHSAIAQTRKQIVPTSYDDFLPKLEDWAKRYLTKFGNRRHHLTFEYVMLKDVNDTPAHAKALALFVNRIGHVRVNLIPYNLTGVEFECSEDSAIKQFLAALEDRHVTTTRRRTMGSDIAAACGQLRDRYKTRDLATCESPATSST
ncbi:23S rRNA (adenine(2503)-C(2))-methyltransferase RlmN [Candidatus Uhrbacteria bacterium]|nr:23S rRNA (adenine(2503)-C(2))-methyltransferase RlmN [Candidatus Uhrbacteria bacterium]